MKMQFVWTKPFYGVQHTKSPRLHGHVTAYNRFVEAWVARPYHFIPIEEKVFVGDTALEDAKSWVEKVLGILSV